VLSCLRRAGGSNGLITGNFFVKVGQKQRHEVMDHFNPRDSAAIEPQMGFSNHFSFFIGIVRQKHI
jgi:hypothetical protein